MKWEFTGRLSGDMECFCWEVDEATWRSIAGADEPAAGEHYVPGGVLARDANGSLILDANGELTYAPDTRRLYPSDFFYPYDGSSYMGRVPNPRYRFRLEILAEDGSEPVPVRP